MATITLSANRSSLFAYRESQGFSLGGGADDHLPIGYFVQPGDGGYRFRSVVDWAAIDWAGLGITAVTSATLTLHRTAGVHVDEVNGASVIIRRATGSWAPNSRRSANDSPAGAGWSSQETNWPGPADTTAGQVAVDLTGTDPEIDVTAIVRAWAPASVAGGSGAVQRGITIRPAVERSTSDSWEAYSAKSSVPLADRPELTIVYETTTQNTPHDAPVPQGGMSADPPMIDFYATDAQGDDIASYDVQVRLGYLWDWSELIYDASELTDGIGVDGITVDSAYAGPALTTGTEYHVRYRVRDATGLESEWSQPEAFIADAGAWDAYEAWARHIIGSLSFPVPVRELGVIYPEGPEVFEILGADYRERIRILATTREPDVDVTAAVYGLEAEIVYDVIRARLTLGDVIPTVPEPEPPPEPGVPDVIQGPTCAQYVTFGTVAVTLGSAPLEDSLLIVGAGIRDQDPGVWTPDNGWTLVANSSIGSYDAALWAKAAGAAESAALTPETMESSGDSIRIAGIEFAPAVMPAHDADAVASSGTLASITIGAPTGPCVVVAVIALDWVNDLDADPEWNPSCIGLSGSEPGVAPRTMFLYRVYEDHDGSDVTIEATIGQFGTSYRMAAASFAAA